MAKKESGDIIYINEKYRSFIEELKAHDVLGFKLLDNKESFMLAVALGVNNPMDCQKKRFGWTRKSYIKTADKALWASVLLGTATYDEEINQYADLDKSIELCEQCAETGFEYLKQQYDKAEGDGDLFERRMLKALDLLYTQVIEDNI